jgi:hypothetical protein
MRNAIPREASAEVVLDSEHADDFRNRALDEFAAIRDAFKRVEPDMALGIEDSDAPKRVLDARTSTWPSSTSSTPSPTASRP